MQEIATMDHHHGLPSIKDGQFTLLRNANVEVHHHIAERGKNVAVITVADNKGERFQHRFPASSRVSKHLDVMTAKDLQERMTGGMYFFIGDQMVDFRDGMYDGFVHSDETIKVFMKLLGYQMRIDLPLHRSSARKRQDGEGNDDILLRSVWSNGEITVPGYQKGADFNSQLSFMWNPFTKTLNSSFDLIRLICSNGMVGVASFLNTKVPLFNRWEDHLDIASTQIQNKVNSIVTSRIDIMARKNASVGDCLLLQEHVHDRLHSKGSLVDGDRERLLRLMAAVSPSVHLSDRYRDTVFSDRNLAYQLPAHLTQFDAFNIATEVRTHTQPTPKSSDNALDKFANGMLFDDQRSFALVASRMGAVKTAAFSDPERAFYGQLDL
jgi:hypothetical protein